MLYCRAVDGRPKEATLPERVLIVKLAELGDALLITPALRALRRGLPSARLHVLTTAGGAAILRDSGLCDDVVVFDKHRFDRPTGLLRPANLRYAAELGRTLRGARYDAVVLFHHLSTRFGALKYALFSYAAGAPRRLGLDNGRGFFLTESVPDRGYGARHELDYALEVAGLLVPAPERAPPAFVIGEEDRRRAAALLEGLPGDGPLIALYPGSGTYAPARRWPVARFAELGDALAHDGARLLLVGGAEEADVRRALLEQMGRADQVLDLGGRTSLRELAAVLELCDLFVGNDGGVLHVAATVGTPVVAPYGPTDPRAWGPWAPERWHVANRFPNGVEVLRSGPHITLRAAIPCSPCIYRGTNLGSPNGCPDRTCLERITVEQVLDTVRSRLGELVTR